MISSPEDEVALDIPSGAVGQDAYVCIWPMDTQEGIAGKEGLRKVAVSAAELVPVGMAYTFSPGPLQLHKNLTVSWQYGGDDVLEPDGARVAEEWKIGLYRLEGAEWVYVGGRGDEATHSVTYTVDRLGTYRLQYDEHRPALPAEFALLQNYPNPFNPVTTIRFHVPYMGAQSSVHLTLKIHNILGQEVRTLLDQEVITGYHQIGWDGKDVGGEDVASGIYFYRMQAEGVAMYTKRMMLIR